MMIRFARTALVAALALALIPATASAAAPQLIPAGTSPEWVDPIFFTSLKVQVKCDVFVNDGVAPDPASRCTGDVKVTGSATDTKLNTVGAVRDIATVPVDLALGETREVTIATPKELFRDTILIPSPTAYAKAMVGFVTPGAIYDIPPFPLFAPWFGTITAKSRPCKVQSLITYTSAAHPLLTQQLNGKVVSYRSATGDFPVGNTLIADKAPLTFRLNGLTYTVTKGTKFSFGCSAVGAIRGGKWFPAPNLLAGQMTVTGTPTGRQYAAVVSTNEGNLGTRSQERAKLVVTRNATAKVSTLKVVTGRTGGITPAGSQHVSPCTNGASLKVDRRGRITAV